MRETPSTPDSFYGEGCFEEKSAYGYGCFAHP
jgi:hypothetical protein